MAKERDRHARIYCRIWDDDDWKALSPRGQWFYMLLASQANLNWAGVIDLTTKRWRQLASGASVDQQVALAMDELEAARFIVVDRDTEELLVRSLMRVGKVAQQPNVLKAALRQAREVHSRPIRAALVGELRRLGHPDADATADALEEGGRNPSGNPSPNPSANPSVNPGEWERESSSLPVSNNSTENKEVVPPSAAPPADSAMEANKAAQRLARVYTDRVKLSNFPAVMMIAKKARAAGYADDDIEAALARLATDGRSVTTDALRYELDGFPGSRPTPNATDQRIAELLRPAGLPNLRALPGGAS